MECVQIILNIQWKGYSYRRKKSIHGSYLNAKYIWCDHQTFITVQTVILSVCTEQTVNLMIMLPLSVYFLPSLDMFIKKAIKTPLTMMIINTCMQICFKPYIMLHKLLICLQALIIIIMVIVMGIILDYSFTLDFISAPDVFVLRLHPPDGWQQGWGGLYLRGKK